MSATVLVRSGRRYYKVRVNPLVRSADKSSVGKNIAWLLKHPGELTAKTPEMRRKQAIAIALSVWRKSAAIAKSKYVLARIGGTLYKVKLKRKA